MVKIYPLNARQRFFHKAPDVQGALRLGYILQPGPRAGRAVSVGRDRVFAA